MRSFSFHSLFRSPWFWATAVTLLSLLLSWQAWVIYTASRAQHDREHAAALAELGFDGIEQHLDRGSVVIRQLQAAFPAQQDPTSAEFAQLFANLRPQEIFPSIQAVAYARRESTEEGVRFITRLVAPETGNEKLMGLAVEAQPANFKGLEESAATNQPSLSQPFPLIQGEGTQKPWWGMTWRLPIYQSPPFTAPADATGSLNQLRGSIALSFRLDRWLEDALPEPALDRLDWRLGTEDGGLMVEHQARWNDLLASLSPASPRFSRQVRRNGQDLVMEAVARPLRDGAGWDDAHAALFAILGALALGGVVYIMVRQQQAAWDRWHGARMQHRDWIARWERLGEVLPGVLLVVRPDGTVVHANPLAKQWLQEQGNPEHIWHACSPPPELAALVNPDKPDAPSSLTWAHCPEHHGGWNLTASRIQVDGTPHLLVVGTDLGPMQALHDSLQHQALHDASTGLPNRRSFEGTVRALLDGHEFRPGAVVFLDLDQFKVLNDTAGHAAGDALLNAIAQSLLSVRAPGEHVARLGGDEFGVVLEGVDRAAALAAAQRYLSAIQSTDFHAAGRQWGAKASVGVACIDEPGLTLKELMARADTACYQAKENGGHRVVMYCDDAPETLLRRSQFDWMSKLQTAVRDNDLELWVQEVCDLTATPATGKRVEALLRWRDTTGQVVPAGTFIPAAERFGMIGQVDRWVVDHALRLLRNTPVEDIAMCAINISAPSLGDPDFAIFLHRSLDGSGVDPARLGVEITETAAMLHQNHGIALLESLRHKGVRIILDDFGAGMASFAYLHTWPIDEVKIDGTFIRARLEHPVHDAVVRAVVDIAQQCGLRVVAESVMTQEDLDYAKQRGVHSAQGYFLHYPEPWADFLARAGKSAAR